MADLRRIIDEAEEHYRRGRLAAAADAYQRVLDQDPDNIEALEWRGEIAVQQDDYETAVETLGRARELRGDDAFAEYTNLGLSYYELNRPEEAVETLWMAVRRNASDLVSHSNLGKALYDLYANNGEEEAVRIAGEWMRRFPEVPDAQHIGPAISGLGLPKTASAAYVEDIFNDYAPIFDEKLAELGYRAPTLILQALEPHLPPPNRDLVVLDAGCGTGLCAPLLSPHAQHLDGVDLSPGMLEKARAKELYDSLEQQELTAYLNAAPERYDLIVAADVLCYFGDLADAMAAFETALVPTGRLGFSVERLLDDDQVAGGYRLNQSGRYKHDPAYVSSILEEAGLILIDIAQEDLRSEYGIPVGGLIVTAAKPA
ncbi:MAG: tetratricopeptide repeat protein [Alphaproteobacteria bacterium]|nr:tetratricopeptide repeat protein [Alphaproteobacteria bacterium]